MAGETELLAHIYARSAGQAGAWPLVEVGPGDDCAVLGVSGGGSVLLTVDQLVEGRHFEPFPRTSLDDAARKAVARSVSDIAAMGGTPTGALAAALLRPGFDEADALFDRMHAWAAHWGCPLIGGDIASLGEDPGPIALTVTVVGEVHASRGPVLRSGARTGDEVWVTGRLGGSLASGRHLRFEPRVEVGRWLCDRLGAGLRAMIDLSDGLGIDAGRVAAASGVRIELEGASVPLHDGVAGWREGVADGEDYELCFVVSPGLLEGGEGPGGVPLTRVGRVVEGEGCVVRAPEGGLVDASALGWSH